MTKRTLTVGLSPCPNDTFIFHALLAGRVGAAGLAFEPVFADVEELNQRATAGELDVTKISFYAYGFVRDRYRLLDSGAALGRGCGPLVVRRAGASAIDWSTARIAIPGRWTSANLLFRLRWPHVRDDQLVPTRFDHILGMTARGEVDAGLIIHESRFTYRDHGLEQVIDLGDWWEDDQGHPIPLGGILAHRRLGDETIAAVDRALAASVRAAREHPSASAEFIREHAQELDDRVTRAHIELYVNEFTESLGEAGRAAVDHLLGRAEAARLLGVG